MARRRAKADTQSRAGLTARHHGVWYGMRGVPYCIPHSVNSLKETCMIAFLSTVLLLLVALSPAQAQ